MAYTDCQGQQHHSWAIWKILKITVPVKLAEQWTHILLYWCYKRAILEPLHVMWCFIISAILSLNTTDELQRHIHTSSSRGAIAILSNFSKKKYNSLHYSSTYRTVSTLSTCKRLCAREPFASVNLWEWNIWEHMEERYQFPIQLFLDRLTTSVVSTQLNESPAFFQTSLSHHRPPALAGDKALCRSSRTLVCTHHTWHLERLQMCRFHMSCGPSSRQRGKAQLFTKTCVRNMGTS